MKGVYMFGKVKNLFSGNKIIKVQLNNDECIGCEKCAEICPEIFIMNETVAKLKCEIVEKKYERSCKEAADTCPMDIIIIKYV